MANKFDRVVSGAKKAGEWAKDKVKQSAKDIRNQSTKDMMDSAVDMASGSSIGGAEAGIKKGVSGTGNRIIKFENMQEGAKRARVLVKNKAAEQAKNIGIATVKDTVSKFRAPVKEVTDEPKFLKAADDAAVKAYRNVKKMSKPSGRTATRVIEDATDLKTVDSGRSQLNKMGLGTKADSTVEEVTKRGKPIGKKMIGEQGGSPSKANAAKRAKWNDKAGKFKGKNTPSRLTEADELKKYRNGSDWNDYIHRNKK